MSIAFCFLTVDNLNKPDIWEHFFKNVNKDKYNIYIHNKNNFKGKFDRYKIDNICETEWGSVSLVRATLKLFEEAFKDNKNKYFIQNIDYMQADILDLSKLNRKFDIIYCSDCCL